MKNIAVLEGGYSHEKVISLLSAETVFKHLDEEKYNPIKVRIDEEGWFAFYDGKKHAIDRSDFSFNNIKFDFIFIVIHGTPGEDGKLQAYFDMLGIPYSTCSHLASTLTFNKFVCNQYLKNFRIKVAEAVLIRQNESFQTNEIVSKVGLPCFVKPADGGSSFGITKVKSIKELMPAIDKAFMYDEYILIESLLIGTEVTCGIHNLNGTIETFPITEIVSENDFFDFEAKYEGKSKEITPARISDDMAKKVSERTIEIYKLLELNGIVRVDFIIMDNEPYIIEANTVPGLSEESIIPQQARCQGISLSELFNQSVEQMFHGK